MDKLLSAIKQAFAWLKNLVKRIIHGIISFRAHIFDWFKRLSLDQNRHIPFIGNVQNPEFKRALKSARVEDVGVFSEQKVGIFKGVYDEYTDEIIHSELLSGDDIDSKTEDILQNDALVVLS